MANLFVRPATRKCDLALPWRETSATVSAPAAGGPVLPNLYPSQQPVDQPEYAVKYDGHRQRDGQIQGGVAQACHRASIGAGGLCGNCVKSGFSAAQTALRWGQSGWAPGLGSG